MSYRKYFENNFSSTVFGKAVQLSHNLLTGFSDSVDNFVCLECCEKYNSIYKFLLMNLNNDLLTTVQEYFHSTLKSTLKFGLKKINPSFVELTSTDKCYGCKKYLCNMVQHKSKPISCKIVQKIIKLGQNKNDEKFLFVVKK